MSASKSAGTLGVSTEADGAVRARRERVGDVRGRYAADLTRPATEPGSKASRPIFAHNWIAGWLWRRAVGLPGVRGGGR